MAKSFYEYTEGANTYAFLQDDAIAAGMGNTGATVGTSRMPDKLIPRKVSIRYGTGPYSYKRHTVGTVALLEALTLGASIGGGIVVGHDWGKDNSQSAY
jgi:hypothetical protein